MQVTELDVAALTARVILLTAVWFGVIWAAVAIALAVGKRGRGAA